MSFVQVLNLKLFCQIKIETISHIRNKYKIRKTTNNLLSNFRLIEEIMDLSRIPFCCKKNQEFFWMVKVFLIIWNSELKKFVKQCGEQKDIQEVLIKIVNAYGGFYSEGTDAFVISSNRRTSLFSWAWNVNLRYFKGLKSCQIISWSSFVGSNSKMEPYLSLQSHFLHLWHFLNPLISHNLKMQAQVCLFEEMTNVSAPSE